MTRTALVYDGLFIEHLKGDMGHPESPRRLSNIYDMLSNRGIAQRCERLPIRSATTEEILLNHMEPHYRRVAATQGRPSASLDPDTWTTPKSFEAALAAVAGGIDLCNAVLDGKVRNGFLLARPPGHHATPSTAMGFCLFNNVAVAAQHLVKKRGLSRVAIVDFDVHHGNGTQDAFYESKSVLYASTHQYPYYPGTGRVGDIGREEGVGHTINVPLPAGRTDADLLHVYRTAVLPVLDEFKPEFLLVSAGYDIHESDPIGGMKVTTRGIGEIARLLIESAERNGGGKVVFFLEGGYHIQALTESVEASIQALLGELEPLPADDVPPEEAVAETLLQVRFHQSRYWKSLENLGL